MKIKRNQSGLVVVELVLIVVFLAVIGFVGYHVMSAKKSVDNANKSIDSTQSSAQIKTPESLAQEPQAPTIDSSKDLDNASKTLDQINPDDTNADVSQLDRDSASF